MHSIQGLRYPLISHKHNPSIMEIKIAKILASWNATAANTHFVQRGFRVDLGNTTNMDDSILAEGGGAHKMVDGLAVDREAGLTIADHDTTVSVDTQEVAHVALWWFTVWALLALPREYRKHMIPRCQLCHSLPQTLNNPAIKQLD
jgi:hypothetical protein